MAERTKPGGGSGLASTAGGGPAGVQDINIVQVLGAAAVTGGFNGSQGVGGLAAHGDAAVGNPNQVGGVYAAAPAVLNDGEVGRFLVDERGRIVTVGDVADGDTEGNAYPLKIGGVASQNPEADSVADGEIAKFITDLERFLRVRSRAYNPVTDADKVENQNLISDDYDPAAIELADVTDQAVARTNYPSDAGYEIGSRDLFGIVVGIRDGEFDVEVSNDGTNWVIATRTVVDVNMGDNGYTAAAHFNEPDAATVYFGITWSDRCEFRYIRLAFTPNDATNIFNAYGRYRAH